MIHYSCDLCKRLIDPEDDLRYVVKIEVYAAVDPVEAIQGRGNQPKTIAITCRKCKRFSNGWMRPTATRSATTSTNNCGSTSAPSAARNSRRTRWAASRRSSSTSARIDLPTCASEQLRQCAGDVLGCAVHCRCRYDIWPLVAACSPWLCCSRVHRTSSRGYALMTCAPVSTLASFRP